jgi:hypothetical protein
MGKYFSGILMLLSLLQKSFGVIPAEAGIK